MAPIVVSHMASLVDVEITKPIINVSMNFNHTCAVVDDLGTNKAYCWGENSQSQLGTGNTTDYGTASSTMASLPLVTLPDAVKSIHTYDQGSCFSLMNGAMHCTGINSNGQKGGSTLTTAINFGTGRSFKAAGRFSQTPCAILNDDSVVCWGYNLAGAAGQDMSYDVDHPTQRGDDFKIITKVSESW